ncbi:MAG TPA: sigma-54 dependent transcriptional regulator [bacterium]|nr:sigma-54 dependent transcriptional regulator [bacterium]
MNEKGKGTPKENGVEFRVLVVDDEQLFCQAVGREIERLGILCDLAYTAADALRLAATNTYHLFLLDHKLPDDDGIRIIPMLLSRQVGATLVMMTAFETIPNAVAAIRQGAEDYLVKQTSMKPLLEKVKEVRDRLSAHGADGGWEEHNRSGLIGRSAAIQRAVAAIEKVAKSPDTTVLITGESGVGKEVAALHLHRMAAPEGSPFIPVDCVALPATLVESILFGHEKGAFTGADKATDGAFSKAGNGTVFLDEIGDMNLDLQGKLLRLLESRKFQRVGSVQQYPLKARIVAATHRDLGELVKEGKFRFDLYQRLSVFPIAIPPLRERREDILPLARHFIEFISQKLQRPVAPPAREVEEILQNYSYPGNVRELKNILERALVLAGNEPIGPQHLPERMMRVPAVPNVAGAETIGVPVDFIPGVDTLESLEKKMIVSALRRTKGVKSAAADILGISRFQLLRRIEKYGLNEPSEEQ